MSHHDRDSRTDEESTRSVRDRDEEAQTHKNDEQAIESSEVSSSEYRDRWQDHVESLERLKRHLTVEQGEILDDSIGQINRLITEAAEHRAQYRGENAHAQNTLAALRQAEREDGGSA